MKVKKRLFSGSSFLAPNVGACLHCCQCHLCANMASPTPQNQPEWEAGWKFVWDKHNIKYLSGIKELVDPNREDTPQTKVCLVRSSHHVVRYFLIKL